MEALSTIAGNRYSSRAYNLNRSPQKPFNDRNRTSSHVDYYSATQSILSTHTTQQKVQKLRIVDNSRYTDSEGRLHLPKEITQLIDNPCYYNRHKKLAREYGMHYLLKLAELAKTKAKPSHWYAKVTSVEQWKDQTEAMLSKLFKKIHEITEQLAGTGVNVKYLPYYINAKRKLSEHKFIRCISNSRSKGVKDPPKLLAYSVKLALEETGSQQGIMAA